jgi:hypothetical protein
MLRTRTIARDQDEIDFGKCLYANVVAPNGFVFFICPNAPIVPHAKPILQIAPAPIVTGTAAISSVRRNLMTFTITPALCAPNRSSAAARPNGSGMKRPPEAMLGGRPDLAEFFEAPPKLDPNRRCDVFITVRMTVKLPDADLITRRYSRLGRSSTAPIGRCAARYGRAARYGVELSDYL